VPSVALLCRAKDGGDEEYCTPVCIAFSSFSTNLVYFNDSELTKK